MRHGFNTLIQSKKCSANNGKPCSPPPKKLKRVHSVGKVMASTFWDGQGVIMIYYLEQGRAMSSAYYAGELRRLRQEIPRKRREKLTRCVLLVQDNAPAHVSQVAMTAATECGFEVPPHPPNSPDMTPSGFYLVPKLKSHLPFTQFRSNKGVIEAVFLVFWGPGKGLLILKE